MRVLALWVACYPQRFQEDCTGISATYTLRDDDVHQGILDRLQHKGYPLDRLQKNLQPTQSPSSVPQGT